MRSVIICGYWVMKKSFNSLFACYESKIRRKIFNIEGFKQHAVYEIRAVLRASKT